MPERSVRWKWPGATSAALTATGLTTAFGAAACCGLPILFAGGGSGAAWLGSLGRVAAPYRVPLLIIAAASLIIGALLLARQQQLARARRPGTTCASPFTRILTFVGLAGFVLLWLGYSYA